MSLVRKDPVRTQFLRLREPASLIITIKCDACYVDLGIDLDGMYCPSCGTQWDHRQGDGDQGEIVPENYDDDDFETEFTENDEAYRRGREATTTWEWEES